MQTSRSTRTSPLAKLNRVVVGSSATKGRRTDNVSGGGGLEIALMIPIFLGLGYLLDRIFGTMPIFMIVMVVLGAIGVFCRLRYGYDVKMREHEEQIRQARQQARRQQP